MLTQLNIIHDQRGYTVQVSTTHQTHAGALAHFGELLAQFTFDHQQAQATHQARAAILTAGPPPAEEADLPHRWHGPGHNGQPIPPTPVPEQPAVATTAEADEGAAPPAPALLKSAPRNSRSLRGEEPPF